MSSYSIIRSEEYRNLSSLPLEGKILDVGGSKKSGYHELIKGDHEFTVINLDKNCEPDFFVDIEKDFPFEDNSFDNAICLNVLEHVFEFQHVFSEQMRCVKNGGKIIIAIPFMHHIHGSPDDYLRYTESSFRRLVEKYGGEIEFITPLGSGFFSLAHQTIGRRLPLQIVRKASQLLCVFLDKVLNKLSSGYSKLSTRIPLGYFVIIRK